MTRHLALFAVLGSLIIPFDGIDVDLCMLHRFSGLPCPGCGMTRAFIALASGELATAVGANPFVLVAYPTFLVLASSTLLSERWRERFEIWVYARSRAVGQGYKICLMAFIGFGLLRCSLFLVRGEPFP